MNFFAEVQDVLDRADARWEEISTDDIMVNDKIRSGFSQVQFQAFRFSDAYKISRAIYNFHPYISIKVFILLFILKYSLNQIVRKFEKFQVTHFNPRFR